LWVRS